MIFPQISNASAVEKDRDDPSFIFRALHEIENGIDKSAQTRKFFL
jgi:hypothetical protein